MPYKMFKNNKISELTGINILARKRGSQWDVWVMEEDDLSFIGAFVPLSSVIEFHPGVKTLSFDYMSEIATMMGIIERELR